MPGPQYWVGTSRASERRSLRHLKLEYEIDTELRSLHEQIGTTRADRDATKMFEFEKPQERMQQRKTGSCIQAMRLLFALGVPSDAVLFHQLIKPNVNFTGLASRQKKIEYVSRYFATSIKANWGICMLDVTAKVQKPSERVVLQHAQESLEHEQAEGMEGLAFVSFLSEVVKVLMARFDASVQGLDLRGDRQGSSE